MTKHVSSALRALMAIAAIAASLALPAAAPAQDTFANPICDPTPGGTCDPLRPATWADYEGVEPIGGTVHIAADGRQVWGTLPPGQSLAEFVDQPGLESLAAAVAAGADTSRLVPYFREGGSNGTVGGASEFAATAASNPHEGCVSAQSYIQSDGLRYKGTMAGCRYGTLWLHTYLNANGARVQDGMVNTCYSTTECSVPYDHYGAAPRCRIFQNYAHGKNRRTGGEDYAWQEHRPRNRWC